MASLTHTLLCVFILWAVPIPPETRYSPFDSFLTLAECKDRLRQLEEAQQTIVFVCVPDTINPNQR